MRVVVDVLLAAAVGVTCLSALGVACLRGPLERLHFVAPATTLGPFFFALAVVLDGGDAQAVLKAIFVALVLLLQSGVIAHATARAVYVRRERGWPPPAQPLASGAAEDRSA